MPIGHGNSFFGHGKVMENRCWKRVATLVLTMFGNVVKGNEHRRWTSVMDVWVTEYLLFCLTKPYVERPRTVSYRCRYKINGEKYAVLLDDNNCCRSYDQFNRYTQNDLILSLLKLTGPQELSEMTTFAPMGLDCHTSHASNLFGYSSTQYRKSRMPRQYVFIFDTFIMRTPGFDLWSCC